ncbi:MAG: carboxypeptidase-like regulatory domain-containing protein [Ferruginibacter sp.]
MQKISLTLFAFLFASAGAYAQLVISGRVVAKESGQALQGASVFADNTTLGTATDADGNYKLYLPNGGYDIVVTFTGYNNESRRISAADAGDKVNFDMRVKEKEMETVAIVATSEVKDGWQKYGSFFLEAFIGKTSNSSLCTLKNPEILKFYFSKRRNRLRVMAAEPLVIENKALGYNIKYALDSFTHEYNTEISLYSGYPLFEEMMAESDTQYRQWKDARNKAYTGSTLHFMRSIYNKTLQEEGFEIQFLVNANNTESAIKLKDFYSALNYRKDDSTQTVEILPNQPNLGIIYTKEKPSEKFLAEHPGEPKDFEFSLLSFQPKTSLLIEQNGYYYDQNDIAISAYWAWNKVADQLPYDFMPTAF